MAVLFCTFASPRSRPEKIHRWIAYLQENQQRHHDEPEAVDLFESLRTTAERWVAGAEPQYSGALRDEPIPAA